MPGPNNTTPTAFVALPLLSVLDGFLGNTLGAKRETDRFMNETMQLLAFSVGDYRYALPLSAVNRIVRAVEVTPLPDAPDTILGLIKNN